MPDGALDSDKISSRCTGSFSTSNYARTSRPITGNEGMGMECSGRHCAIGITIDCSRERGLLMNRDTVVMFLDSKMI
jgi:hypothetical protein